MRKHPLKYLSALANVRGLKSNNYFFWLTRVSKGIFFLEFFTFSCENFSYCSLGGGNRFQCETLVTSNGVSGILLL